MTHPQSLVAVLSCDRARYRLPYRIQKCSLISTPRERIRANLIARDGLRVSSIFGAASTNDLERHPPISTTSPTPGRPRALSTDMEGRGGGAGGAGGGTHLAVVAGIFATGGSLLGKLAGGADASSLPSLFLKGVLLVFMIVCNTVGCTFFVKALHASGSSLPITVASAATSYVCSAFIGSIVFDESTSLIWWCGTSLVLLGLMLICNVPVEKKASTVEEKLKHQ